MPTDTPIRLRIDLAYDGTDFSGWAAQPGRRTVEGELVAALRTVLRRDDLRLVTAGRTDAGVHARGAVVHVDVPTSAWVALPGRSTRPPEDAAVTRLRGVLPGDLRVRSVAPAAAGFDARFSAVWRRYRYLICDDPAGPEPLRRWDVVAHRRPLDVPAMDEAARRLVGLHDFAAFCKRREGATTIRTLLAYRWTRTPDGLIEARVEADAFCHSMVRSLVGAVVPVGEGRKDVEWPRKVLTAAVKDSGVVVMPPHGLSLEEVGYPPEGELAARAASARAVRALPAPAVTEVSATPAQESDRPRG